MTHFLDEPHVGQLFQWIHTIYRYHTQKAYNTSMQLLMNQHMGTLDAIMQSETEIARTQSEKATEAMRLLNQRLSEHRTYFQELTPEQRFEVLYNYIQYIQQSRPVEPAEKSNFHSTMQYAHNQVHWHQHVNELSHALDHPDFQMCVQPSMLHLRPLVDMCTWIDTYLDQAKPATVHELPVAWMHPDPEANP